MPRAYDLVLFGATGFVGRLVAEYLVLRQREGNTIRWAIAGRDRERLDALRVELGAPDLPLQVADAANMQSLQQLACGAAVVCSTVGPYAVHGNELVAACAAAGTHYCDITGEVQWVRQMIDAHENTARRTGARLVHCCGFDSIPSDLGCLLMNETMRAREGGPCEEVRFLLRKARGGFSGGTVASLLHLLQAARSDPALRRLLADPYSLNPDGAPRGPGPRDSSGVRYDAQATSWTAPFLMAPVNTRIVRRSNALLDFSYGENFRYSETVTTGRGPRGWATATALAAGLAAFLTVSSAGPLRRFLERRVLPSPGEGPSAAEREAGFFDIRFLGLRDGRQLWGRMTGDRDPGYGATSRMLGECALSLVGNEVRAGLRGGSWTPASCFGAGLMTRLQQHAGLAFSIDG